MKINIDHEKKLVPVDQGDANLCWLASASMMKSWEKGNQKITMSQLAKELGGEYYERYLNKAALPGSDMINFASELGLICEGLKSMTSEWWIKTLTAGPIFVCGYDGSGSMGHAIVLVGLSGDKESIRDAKIKAWNPRGPILDNLIFKDFIDFYERLAQSGFPQLLFYQHE